MTHGLPVIVIELERGRYKLPLEQTAGIRESRAATRLPFRSKRWNGMIDWSGTAVTVLNAAELLGDRATGDDSVLLRLAPPYQTIALQIDGRVRMERIEAPPQRTEASTAEPRQDWLDLDSLIADAQTLGRGVR